VVVGKEKDIYSRKLIAKDVNWIMNPHKRMFARVRIRYHSKEAWAYVSVLGKERAKVKFLKAQRAVTPGQSVVFYQGDYVVGGGTIE